LLALIEHDLPMTTTQTSYNGVVPKAREITTQPRFSDKVFRFIVTSGGFTSLIILSLIAIFLLQQGFPVLKDMGFGFITGFEWNPGDPDNGVPVQFGIGAMLIGTLLVSVIGLIIALPIAVGTALFLTYYAPDWIKKPLTITVDLMAAIPSVIYGLWGFFILMPHAVYWAKLLHHYLGFLPFFKMPADVFERSPFIAGIVVGIMIIPIITAISREVFSQVPLDRIQAAYALGATKWMMIRSVVLPFGSSGVAGGAMLGLGRAMGETIAIYLVLNIYFAPNFQVLFSAGGNVASLIVSKFGEAGNYELRALMAAGLVLFIVTLLVNFLSNAIVKRTSRTGK
jgi:phosphate transport system permease protein